MQIDVNVTVPNGGIVRDTFLAQHSPYSVDWYRKGRLYGFGPPFHKLGARTVVYLWNEFLAWAATHTPKRQPCSRRVGGA